LKLVILFDFLLEDKYWWH